MKSPTKPRKPKESAKPLFAEEPRLRAVNVDPLPDISPLKPTVAYNTYWRFASERQEILFRRMRGEPAPWTHDPILLEHKFTNAYRASDRVSQYLIRNVIYRDDLPDDKENVVFRILLFKLFNRIETWELLEKHIGPITFETFSFREYDKVLSKALAQKITIYSAAYIMPSAGQLGHSKKHKNHLTLIERFMRDGLPEKLAACKRMKEAFNLILAYPSIGDFLAYQFVTDINYSKVTDFPEDDFVVPGPGAIDGIAKCFSSTAGWSGDKVIKFMAERQDDEFKRLGIPFRRVGNRPLQLIDCQNLFCEVGKYCRIKHPELAGVSDRTRIKQKFRANTEPITYFYPPKWKIEAQKTEPSQSPPSLPWGNAMDFNEYQIRAAKTDRNPSGDGKGMMIPILGLAGEAGAAVSEYKKLLRDGESDVQFSDRMAKELGDILWYLSTVASRFDLKLSDIAEQNLIKCENRWGAIPKREAFDKDFPESQRFQRRFLVDFATTHDDNENPRVQVFYKGKPFGDPLTDNSYEPDGYGYHDAIHFAFAAVLGWSPLVRKFVGAKRKDNKKVDEVEDGGRAIATEEGLSAMIFAYARGYNWLEGKASISSDLLRMIRNMVSHLEVGVCTEGEWESTIVQGFNVFREIRKRGSGTLVLNLDERTITVKEPTFSLK